VRRAARAAACFAWAASRQSTGSAEGNAVEGAGAGDVDGTGTAAREEAGSGSLPEAVPALRSAVQGRASEAS
jgi:hypothetical protein